MFRLARCAFAATFTVALVAALVEVAAPASASTPSCVGIVKTVVNGWGQDEDGEVGVGRFGPPILFPISVNGSASTMRSLSSGGEDSAAITNCGGVMTWGDNGWGQLGTDYGHFENSPVPVPGLTNILKVAVGNQHMLALGSKGTVWGWGRNDAGEIGFGANTPEFVPFPVQVPGLTGIVDISAGVNVSAAVASNGTVWTWGDDLYGMLGDGHASGYRATPYQVPGLTGVTHVSVGDDHVLALRSDGTIVAWGSNFNGEIGDGTLTPRLSPVQTRYFGQVTQVATAWGASLAVTADGSVWTWGGNYEQQLGRSAGSFDPLPGVVPTLSGVTQASAGDNFFLVHRSDGTVWGWGDNENGQMGLDNTQASYALPVQNQTLSNVTQVAAGGLHALALRIVR